MTDADWVRVTRARFRWSQEQLAERLGLSRYTVARWEVKGAELDKRDRLAIEAVVARETAARAASVSPAPDAPIDSPAGSGEAA